MHVNVNALRKQNINVELDLSLTHNDYDKYNLIFRLKWRYFDSKTCCFALCTICCEKLNTYKLVFGLRLCIIFNFMISSGLENVCMKPQNFIKSGHNTLYIKTAAKYELIDYYLYRYMIFSALEV